MTQEICALADFDKTLRESIATNSAISLALKTNEGRISITPFVFLETRRHREGAAFPIPLKELQVPPDDWAIHDQTCGAIGAAIGSGDEAL